MNDNTLVKVTVIGSFIIMNSFLLCVWIVFLKESKFKGIETLKMDYLYSTLNSTLIYDIKIGINLKCPNGYSVLKLKLDDYLTDEYYSENQSSHPDSNYLNSEADIYFGSTICVLRGNKTYLDFNVGICRKNLCGTLDLLKNQICDYDMEFLVCPINEVKIIGLNDNLPPDFESVYLPNTNKLIAFARSNNGTIVPPITDLTVSLGRICSHPLEIDASQNETSVLYYNYNWFGGCRTKVAGLKYNPNQRVVYNGFGTEFFKIETLRKYHSVLGEDIYYNLYENERRFNLNAESYSGLKNNNCKTHINTSPYYSNPYDNSPAILGLTIMMLVFTGILIPCCCRQNTENASKFFYFTIIIFAIVCLTVAWVFYGYQKVSLFTFYVSDSFDIAYTSYLDQYALIENCFSEYSKEMISFVYNFYSPFNYFYLISCIIITILNTVFVVILLQLYILHSCYKKELDELF